MVNIIFEAHSTTLDNENHVSSGHYDVELSELGLKQSRELGERYADDKFDAIFCSDLRRSYKTAELAFDSRFPIKRDARLRECDYGDFTRRPSSEVDPEKVNRITVPFPNGESYEQTAQRMGGFLADLLRDYEGKRVMIIGHRATQYGLERWISGLTIKEAVTAPWKWQAGWHYELEELSE
jgi:broad specificity phosphatase PhoE